MMLETPMASDKLDPLSLPTKAATPVAKSRLKGKEKNPRRFASFKRKKLNLAYDIEKETPKTFPKTSSKRSPTSWIAMARKTMPIGGKLYKT